MTMDDSLRSSSAVSSTGSSNGTGTGTVSTLELEDRFNRALKLDSDGQSRMLEESELDGVTQEELDALFAKDMFELTGEERDEVMQDIHGIADLVEETPEFVLEQRQLLDKELSLLVSHSNEDTSAYQDAMIQDETFVRSEKFQVMFLRADQWDAREAAARVISFFALKIHLFGPDRLTSKITYQLLSKDDRKALESGFFQVLPVRDSAGRVVVTGIPPLLNYKHVDNLKRLYFYVMMTLLEDEATQKFGVVMVGYNMGPMRKVDPKAAYAIQSTKKFLPLRVGSIHYCYDDFRFRLMMTVCMLVIGSSRRVRFRAHYGKDVSEVMATLATFGIPSSSMPIGSDDNPKIKSHKAWLKARREQEQKEELGQLPKSIIVIPNRADVLLGRGKPIQEHFGNIRYHMILDHYQDVYERSQKFQKMKIATCIVEKVHEHGGRFLKQEGAGWLEVDISIAKEKIGHAYRTRRAAGATKQAHTINPVVKRRYSNQSTQSKESREAIEPKSKVFGDQTALAIAEVSDTENDFDHGKRQRY